VFDQVREIVRDPSFSIRGRSVNQRYTKEDYARKFDLWSVACSRVFINECRSFIAEFVVIFAAHMWKNRLLRLSRSGQRGVHLSILSSIYMLLSFSILTLPLVLYFQPCVLCYIIACIQLNPYRKSQLITRLYLEKLTRDGKV